MHFHIQVTILNHENAKGLLLPPPVQASRLNLKNCKRPASVVAESPARDPAL